MLLSRSLCCCAVTMFLILGGCGSALPEGARPTKPVRVTVTYNGQPVEGATVTFISEGEPLASYGRTDAAGVAQMKTYVEGDGAVLGKHKVTINKTEVSGGAPAVDQDSPEYVPPELSNAPPTTVQYLVPPKYTSPATSDLTAEVTESGPNEFRFDLKD